MKLAFVYPPMLVGGRPLDFSAIDTSPRGTTGSEIHLLSMAREMAARGHECSLYIEAPSTDAWAGVAVRPLMELGDHEVLFSEFDPEPLKWARPHALRVIFQQCGMFPRQDLGAVDLAIAPSRAHRDWMIANNIGGIPRSKWAVAPNGCDVGAYPAGVEKIQGRAIYASSPDRGLHLLLQAWPEIKKAVPYASLKIFYFGLAAWIAHWRSGVEQPGNIYREEDRRRALYIDTALKALAGADVEVVGCVSRKQMALEMGRAEVIAYPCDPVAYTETFCCVALEGCAAGALPVLSAADALASLYGDVCPMAPMPIRRNIGPWRDLLIRAFVDKPWADEHRNRARSMAERMTWPAAAATLEEILLSHTRHP